MADVGDIITRKVSELLLLPGNPRRISKTDMERLMASIRKYGFWRHRPIAISTRTGEEIVICGNQRLKAARKLGLKSVPAIIYNNLDEQEENDIVLRDNINNGEWDFEALQDDKWGDLDFKEIGIDMPAFDEEIKGVKSEHTPDNRADNFPENNEDRNAFYQSMLTDCLYESNNLFEIPNLRLDMQAGKLQLPFAPYGAESRQKKGVCTYHFYVDDYRFEAIWKDPTKVLNSGCVALVEPNLSLFDTTPIAWGLQQIYKKRWISRYFQECGIFIYADLNVSRKFYDYNRMGIPDGYNAFFTRGYADRLEYLKAEHRIAKEISGKETPNLIIYGGGKVVQEYCASNSLVYVEQLMTAKRNG